MNMMVRIHMPQHSAKFPEPVKLGADLALYVPACFPGKEKAHLQVSRKLGRELTCAVTHNWIFRDLFCQRYARRQVEMKSDPVRKSLLCRSLHSLLGKRHVYEKCGPVYKTFFKSIGYGCIDFTVHTEVIGINYNRQYLYPASVTSALLRMPFMSMMTFSSLLPDLKNESHSFKDLFL